MKGIMNWVRLHPYNISQKVQVVVEHFRANVAPLLNGKAKAMVVVSSRLEAVRWKLAIDKYIAEKGYGIGTLVAFSGEINDPSSGPDAFTERSPSLNPRLGGQKIEKAFEQEDCRILLVANKFQTGFDQPLLCGMYVDKRLAGIQAVQTLSRLNRAAKGKDTTYILDFVNDAEEIREAFKTYYETAELATNTDPNLVYNLRAKLDGAGWYDDHEVECVVAAELRPGATQADLVRAIEPVCSRLLGVFSTAKAAWRAAKDAKDDELAKRQQEAMDALTIFKADMALFIRAYVFLGQIVNFENTDLERRAIFYRRLLPLLEFGQERDEIDLSKVRLTHYNLRSQGDQKVTLVHGVPPKLEPMSEAGSGKVNEKIKSSLAEIIERVNELFEGELTEGDKLVYVNNVLMGKLLESPTLQQQAASNTRARFNESPDLRPAVLEAVLAARTAHESMSKQALDDPKVMEGLVDILVNFTELYDQLRQRAKSA
jgi:type I restriction enzyme R subunit